MAKKNFKVGDRVGLNVSFYLKDEWDDNPKKMKLKFRRYDNPSYGTITAINGDTAQVEWNGFANDALDYLEDDANISLKDLLPEEEMKVLYSDLEKEFKVTEKQVKAHLKEAAKFINEAQKLASKQGQNLHDMGAAYGPLYDALDNAGWRTSSFGC